MYWKRREWNGQQWFRNWSKRGHWPKGGKIHQTDVYLHNFLSCNSSNNPLHWTKITSCIVGQLCKKLLVNFIHLHHKREKIKIGNDIQITKTGSGKSLKITLMTCPWLNLLGKYLKSNFDVWFTCKHIFSELSCLASEMNFLASSCVVWKQKQLIKFHCKPYDTLSPCMSTEKLPVQIAVNKGRLTLTPEK